MNISEFERNKPRATMAAINGTIKKFQEKKKNHSPPMEERDVAAIFLINEFLKDLDEIKRLFAGGK